MTFLLILIALIALAFIAGIVFSEYLFGRRRSAGLQAAYDEDVFWNVIIRWKWKTREGKKVPFAFEKICPHCRDELTINTLGEYHFLHCELCSFISNEFHKGSVNDIENVFESVVKQKIMERTASVKEKG